MTEPLLALADHDTAMVQARHAVEHPPSLPAHAEAVEALRTLRDQKRELDVARDPLRDRAAALERDAGRARARAGEIAARLAAATGAGRELEAMAHERDSLGARADALEDELLAVLDALEPLDARDAELRSSAQAATATRDELARRAETEREDATHALAAIEAGRGAVAAALDPALLARYEAIAARRGGVGAARLRDGRCEACHVAVPAALADRLAHAPDAVEACDECGRLLVVA